MGENQPPVKLAIRESSCAKSLKMDYVMKVVVKIVNFIKLKGLNHRQFQEFLKSLDSEHGFEDKEWVSDFAFLVDKTSHLNELNTRLQGKDQLINDMHSLICAFQMKLGLWEQQLKTKKFTHFPTLSEQPDITPEIAAKYASLVSDLKIELENRFQDFNEHRLLLSSFATPFSTQISALPGHLQMECCEMKCDTHLKEKFYQVCLQEVYKTYLDKEKYPVFHKHALFMISLFENTYVCEQLFSRMKHIKSQMRTRITGAHLENCLRVATTSVEINMDALSSAKQSQTSH